MTNREKLLQMVDGHPAGNLSWSTIIDSYTVINSLPENHRELTPIDFYRHIGCDIILFGGLGLKESGFEYGLPYSTTCSGIEIHQQVNEFGLTVTTTETNKGCLTRIEKRGYVIKHEIETIEDVLVLQDILEHTFVGDNDRSMLQEQAVSELLGGDGVQFHAMEPSPVQMMLEYYAGVEVFYYLLEDYQKIMEDTLEMMHEVQKNKYRSLCRNSSHAAVIAVENTSTTLISPRLYQKYSQRHIDDYTEIAHSYRKKMIVHMCGLIKDLLPVFEKMNFDGIHAATPYPVGNTPADEVFSAISRNIYVLGGFDPTVFSQKNISRAHIEKTLESIYTKKVRESPFTLLLPADGLAVEYDNFMYVRQWFENQKQ